jgi:AcrR family transcriptional regulator
MTQRPVRRPGGRSARVRTAVIEATIAELIESGFAGMSLQRVAARAGVNKTTVYRRWPTKGSLLAEALLSDLPQPSPPTGDVRRDLLALTATAPPSRGGKGLIDRSAAVMRALDAAGSDPEVVAARAELWQRRLAVVDQAVAAAKQAGTVRSDLDPELVLDVLFGAFHNRVVSRGERFSHDFADRLIDLLLH